MTVNIKDVVITMNEAQSRSLEDDKKKLVQLATALISATEALNTYATEAAESYEEFGLTKSGLVAYAKAQAKTGSVSGEVSKLEAKIEEFEFLDNTEKEV